MNFKIKDPYASLINHLFQMILVTYLALLLIEQIWPGAVSLYLNLNLVLIVVIITGVLDVFADIAPAPKQKAKTTDYLFAFSLGILGAVIIWLKLGDLGWLRWVISLIAGALIILLSFLVLEEDN